MQPTTTDVSGAIRKMEVETRASKMGKTYDVFVVTLTTGDKVEITTFSPVDKGSLTLLKVLARPGGNTPK